MADLNDQSWEDMDPEEIRVLQGVFAGDEVARLRWASMLGLAPAIETVKVKGEIL
jgi:hypothetical protein